MDDYLIKCIFIHITLSTLLGSGEKDARKPINHNSWVVSVITNDPHQLCFHNGMYMNVLVYADKHTTCKM